MKNSKERVSKSVYTLYIRVNGANLFAPVLPPQKIGRCL